MSGTNKSAQELTQRDKKTTCMSFTRPRQDNEPRVFGFDFQLAIHWATRGNPKVLSQVLSVAFNEYVTPLHKTSLNSRLADIDKHYQLNSRLGVNMGDFHFLAKMHSWDLKLWCCCNLLLDKGHNKVLKPLLMKMCKSTKTHNTETFKAFHLYHFKQQTLRFLYTSKNTQNGS